MDIVKVPAIVHMNICASVFVIYGGYIVNMLVT